MPATDLLWATLSGNTPVSGSAISALCSANSAAVAKQLLDALLLENEDPKLVTVTSSDECMRRTLSLLLCAGELRASGVERAKQLCTSLGATGDPAPLIGALSSGAPALRRVCQYPFRKNDIVWICRDCQADETCVLCNQCYKADKHEGHEVYFYHAQAGGCCDCGDPDAWDSAGFCGAHGLDGSDPLNSLPASIIELGRPLLYTVTKFLLDLSRDWPACYDFTNIGTRQWFDSIGAKEGEELEVVVHGDDVHSIDEVRDALQVAVPNVITSSVIASLFDHRLKGEAVVFKANDVVGRLSEVVKSLSDSGLHVTVRGARLKQRQEKGTQICSWLNALAGVSAGACRLVSEQFSFDTLHRLMMAEARLPRSCIKGLHALYLTLMADQIFKMRMAQAYVKSLPQITKDFAAGYGSTDQVLYGLSVQFLNRGSFVIDLAKSHDLLTILSDSLLTILTAAIPPRQPNAPIDPAPLDTSHMVLFHRRYLPVVADLKCVLNIKGVPRLFIAMCFPQLMRILSLIDGMDPVRRRFGNHVSEEPRSWMQAFNVNISISSIFEYVVGWLREPVQGVDVAHAGASAAPAPGEASRWLRFSSPSQSSLECSNGGGSSADPSLPSPLEFLEMVLATLKARISKTISQRGRRASATLAAAQCHARVLEAFTDRDQQGSAASAASASSVASGTESDNLTSVSAAQAPGYGLQVPRSSSAAPVYILPLYPQSLGFLELPPPPSFRSFHLAMHRFMACLIREACKCEARMVDLWSLSGKLGEGRGGPALALALVDAPLLVLELAAEIRAGLWRRNGQSMGDQVLNYAEQPFCKMFRDLDILAVQFAALSCGPTRLVNHILHRYRCWELLVGEPSLPKDTPPPRNRNELTDKVYLLGSNGEEMEVSIGEAGTSLFADPAFHDEEAPDTLLRGMGAALDQRLGVPPPLAPQQQLALAEECLRLLILIITEMPLPPDKEVELKVPRRSSVSGSDPAADSGGEGDGTTSVKVNVRVMSQLRREMIHKLASGPSIHSDLQESRHIVGQAESFAVAAQEALLHEIATVRSASSSLEPEMFVLKPELYSEYDPTFFHITLQSHQLAAEKKPKPTDTSPPAPPCPPPPLAHPMFQLFRVSLLRDEALIKVIANALRGSDPALTSGTLVQLALHLLGIAVHTFTQHGADADIENAAKSTLCGESVDMQVTTNDVEEDYVDVRGSRMMSEAAPVRATVEGRENRHSFSGFGSTRQAFCTAVLKEGLPQLLLNLRSKPCFTADKSMQSSVTWLLQGLRAMGGGLEDAIPQESGADKSDGDAVSARRAAARAKAMAMVQQHALKFSKNSAFMMDDSEEEEGKDVANGVENGSSQASTTQAVPICIVCREVKLNEPLGYVGLGQRSTTLTPPRGDTTNAEPPCGGVHLQFCGHTLHMCCFDQYFASSLQRAGQQQHHALDETKGEFYCPLCKTVCNLLLPHVPPMSPEKLKEEETQDIDNVTGGCYVWSTRRLPLALKRSADDPEWSLPPPNETFGLAANRFLKYIGDITLTEPPLTTIPVKPIEDFEKACAALAYTITVAAEEWQATDTTHTKRAARLKAVIRALRRSAVDPSVGISNVIRKKIEIIVSGDTKVIIAGQPECAPLLDRNIFESLALLSVLLPRGDMADLSAAIRSMFLARLLQVLARYRLKRGPWAIFEGGGGAVTDNDIAELFGMTSNPSVEEEEDDLVALYRGRAHSLAVGVDTSTPHTEEGQWWQATSQNERDPYNVGATARYCSAFLRSCALLQLLCEEADDGMDNGNSSTVNSLTSGMIGRSETFLEQCSSFGVPHTASGALSNPEFVTMAKKWLAAAARKGSQALIKSAGEYPLPLRVDLIRLPYAYTELHAALLATVNESKDIDAVDKEDLDNSDKPAVCLVCGKVVNAGGSGQCTAHAAECGLGVGVFFLLQECSVLFIYGVRAIYFFSPYVDAYGEKHKHAKGRPLFLDIRRYGVVRSLWARHLVAQEVVQTRSTRHQVIWEGFY